MDSAKPSDKPTADDPIVSAAFLAAVVKAARLKPLLLNAQLVVMTPEQIKALANDPKWARVTPTG